MCVKLMKTVTFFMAMLASAAFGQAGVSGSALDSGLFALNELDLHLHAGMERPVSLMEWVDYAVKDGRKVVVLLDHLELYRKTGDEYRQWRADKGFAAEYPVGAAGHAALMTDFDTVKQRGDVIVFRGWEISEDELDTGVEEAPMRLADVLGWHISPKNGRAAPDGQTLLKRARQIKELQQRFPVPMVLFHPFTMRMENLQRTAQKDGRDPETITAEQYRFFQPGEQEELAKLLEGSFIYIEISSATKAYWETPACREAMIADIRPLAELGVQFIVSTDAHGVANITEPFHPETYCTELGVTAANTNTIVRELLAIRAKQSVSKAVP